MSPYSRLPSGPYSRLPSGPYSRLPSGLYQAGPDGLRPHVGASGRAKVWSWDPLKKQTLLGYKGTVMNELYAILVPKFYGPMPGEYLVDTPIPGEELQAFQVLCVERTGGLTIAPDCKGIWVDPNDATGKTYMEPMTPYMVMTDSATVRELALKVKELYQQKAVMFYRVSDLCQIV